MFEDIKEKEDIEDIKEKTEYDLEMPQVIIPPKLKNMLKNEKSKQVKLTQLVPFENHPFKVPSPDDPDMKKLISSIKQQEGVLEPPIVRKLKKEHEEDEDKYQIISGHRRVKACKFLGFEKIPVRVVDITDDDATITMISSNIQREKIDFAEQVRACALMYETKKHQGKATDKEGKSTRDDVAEIWGVGANKVQRYVEISKLSDKYLEFIGKKRISVSVGIEVSKMSDNTQRLIEDILSENIDLKITKNKQKKLRKLQKN